MNTVVIGGGTMGGALLQAALAADVVGRADVTVVEVIPERREALVKETGVLAVASPEQVTGAADVIMLAVKPQDLPKIRCEVAPRAMILSIMAGVPIATIAAQFGHERIVRVMPNLPAAIRAGMCVWTATAEVSEAQRAFAASFVGAAGAQIYVEDEGKLDMATAVSGSGPGYVYLLIEGLVEGAVAAGLPRDQATEMAVQTFLGAASYAKESGIDPATLRGMVTSPGGTTAAGLLALEQRAVRAAMIEAVAAALRRARELGGQ